MADNVALLNPARDLQCAAQMVAHVEAKLREQEKRLTSTRMSHDDYARVFTAAETLRSLRAELSEQLRKNTDR